MSDDLFDALADPYRRRLLVALLDEPAEDALQMPDAIHEGDVPIDQLEIELYHMHLPKLAAAGFVRWDPDAREVTEGPRFEEIEPVVALLDANADALPVNWP